MMTKRNGRFYGEHSGLITNTPKKQLKTSAFLIKKIIMIVIYTRC